MSNEIRNFIINICSEILEDEYSQQSIKNYLLNVKLEEIEYTGNGCFINLDSQNSELELELINNVYDQNDLYFDGLELNNDDENLLCDINVLILQNKIDLIEIWNKLGTKMIKIPKKYTLKKTWK